MKKQLSDYQIQEHLNPGQRIRVFLESKYTQNSSFVQQMDNDFLLDGSLHDTFYNSSINYLLRRLISVGHFMERTHKLLGDARIKIELRKYLKDYTRYKDQEIEQLIPWLLECVRNSKADFSDRDKHTVKQQVVQYEWGCFICGREMDLAKDSQSYLASTADHKWPRALGGESIPENLRYACKDCNNKYKRDFLDYSDFHYEHIIFIIDTYPNYLKSSRNRNYEAAIFAKSDYTCVVCGQPAYRVGELFIGRNDPVDTFHFFNLSAYCGAHNPEW